MSTEATVWAMNATVDHPLSRWLLVVMSNAAGADGIEHICEMTLERLCQRTLMPLRSLHFHLKALQSLGYVTPLLGPIDQHGKQAVIGYRLAAPADPFPTATHPEKTRQRRSLPQQDTKERAAETEAHDPGAIAPPITVAAGSRAWWSIFWQKVMSDEPTNFMVTEGEQGHPWPVTGPLPSDEAEAALVELTNDDQGAAWEIWLAGHDARWPVHPTAENPGKVFAPHLWPRELV
jgi:hypothetical protein